MNDENTDETPGPPQPPIVGIDTILDNALLRLVDEPCDFCGRQAHHRACPELLAFTERVKARVFQRLAHPRPCPSCGDETCADLCAACQESEVAHVG